MKIKAAFKYQLYDHIPSITVFYLILVAVFLVTSFAVNISVVGTNGEVDGQFTGIEFATAIFVFISGLCSFSEPLHLLFQNGATRKNIFLGRCITTAVIALILTSADKILTIGFYALNFIFKEKIYGSSFYELLYNIHADKTNFFQVHITSYFFNFFLYLSVLTVGYLIAALYYRMNKALKIAVSVGTPCFVFIVIPFIDYSISKGAISKALEGFINIAFGLTSKHSINAMLTCFIAFLVFSALSWLLLRRATVKGK